MLARLEGCEAMGSINILAYTGHFFGEVSPSVSEYGIKPTALSINKRCFAWPWERAFLKALIEFRDRQIDEGVMAEVVDACCVEAQMKRKELFPSSPEEAT